MRGDREPGGLSGLDVAVLLAEDHAFGLQSRRKRAFQFEVRKFLYLLVIDFDPGEAFGGFFHLSSLVVHPNL